jgi:hypothetical protein
VRTVLVLLSLLIAAFSVGTDILQPEAGSAMCRLGFCRFDQVFRSIDAQGMQPDNVGALVNEDPANPLVWCVYGDVLGQKGRVADANAAIEHAMSLGPHMPPVLMRGVNFYVGYGNAGKIAPLSMRILAQSGDFDQILFSYFQRMQTPVTELLGNAIPNDARAARSWLDWLRTHGSEADLTATWTWMQRNHLLDKPSAVGAIWALWSRKSYRVAHSLWLEWAGTDNTDRSLDGAEQLVNRQFQNEPAGGPFDWTLDAAPSATLTRKDGLDVRFSGKENVAFSGVRQAAEVRPGLYRFTAEVEASGLTTDQHPYFHVFDPANPGAVHVESQQIQNGAEPTRISMDISTPASTQALLVQLERRPSERFDNKIEGTVHVREVSLRRK